MSRKFIIKVGGTKDTKYEIHVNDTESYEDFIAKLNHEHSVSDEGHFKFMCKGKMINKDNFDTLQTGSVLLAIICKKGQITEPSTSTSTSNQKQIVHLPNCTCTCNKQSVQQPVSVPEPEPVSLPEPIQSEPTFTYDETKGSLIVFLNFMKTNPEVNKLYQSDFPQLVNELVHNPQLAKIIKDILGQSKQILNAIQTGGNIAVKLGGENGGSTEEINMTSDDGKIIDELIAMGFDSTEAVVAYLKNNKDKSAAINALLGNIEDVDLD